MNFGGGFFGVGPPEVLVVLAVGWFVLGPKQLLELSRDVGKIIGQVRRAAGDARETFTDAVQTDIAEMEARENATKVEGPVLPGEDEPILETDEEIAAAAALSPPKENPLDTLKSLIDPEPPVRTQIQQAPPSVVQQQQSIFLDQLSRANDPAQTVPDLSMEDEEDEVARLEMQLQAAREKLQEKKKSENAAPPPPAAPAASNGTPNESNEATDKTR